MAAQGFGELLVADIAARDGQVKVNGWRDGAGVALDDAVAQLTELGFKHLVYTDIARDGMQTGIDVAAYRHVAEVAGFPVVASGGISTLDDIRALAAVGEDASRVPLPVVRSTRATLRWPRRWPPPEGRSSPCLPNA